MIEVKRHNDGVTITGHANYAKPGQDIVCAAVSVLVQTLIQSIEDLCTDRIEYDMSAGSVDIKHGNLSHDAKLLVDSFFLGIEMIENSYPHNVSVEK